MTDHDEQAAADQYERAINTPPSAEACAAIRELLDSGNLARRKVRTTPDNPATSSDTPDSPLRQQIAAAIHRYDNHHGLSGNDIPSRHHYGEADAVLAEILPHGKFLGDMARESETEVARLRQGLADVIADMHGVTGARHWIAALDSILNPPAPAHDDGPSVQEAAADDRRYWDVEKAGEA